MLFSKLKPMVVSKAEKAFDDEKFLFEPKWDGWRILLHKQGNRLEAYTGTGNLVTHKFPELREAVSSIKSSSAILDCEGICIREGRSVFDDFTYRGRISDSNKIINAQRTHPASFVAFDVLFTDVEHLNEPLMTRKSRLREMIEPTPILTSNAFIEGQGIALSAWSVEHDMEGIVAKRKDSKYVMGVETKDWLKINNFKTIDTILLGYRTQPQFGLMIGLHFRTTKYKPVGVVESGFSIDEQKAFLELAKELHTHKEKQIQWIKPILVCRIQYLERTSHHQLRITSFKGFIHDKSPDQCYWTY